MIVSECRRALSIFVAFCVLFFAAACGGPEQQPEIRFSAFLPLSGDLAFLGVPGRHALEIAQEEFNASGGVLERRLKVDFQDTTANPAIAGLLVERLPQDSSSRTVLTTLSGVSTEVARLSEKVKPPILQFVIAIHPTVVMEQYRNVRLCYNAADEANLLAQAIVRIRPRRLAVALSVDAVSTVEYEQFIAPELSRHRIHVETREEFNVGQSDFRPMARRLDASGPDAILLLGYGSDFPKFMDAIRRHERLRNIPILGGIGFIEVPANVDTRDYRNVHFGAPEYLLRDPAELGDLFTSFAARYRSKDRNAQIPPYDAIYTYDSIRLWKQAVEQTKSFDPDQLLKHIRTMREFQSILGPVPMKGGDSHPAVALGQFASDQRSTRFVRSSLLGEHK